MCSELDGGEQVSAVVQRKKDEGGRRPNCRPAWGRIRKQDVGTTRSQKRSTNLMGEAALAAGEKADQKQGRTEKSWNFDIWKVQWPDK